MKYEGKMAKLWYYTWDDGNYANGLVLGFDTMEEARKHASENRPNSEIEIELINQVIEIYTGE